MNRLMIVLAALGLWCGTARALPTWTTMSPGGGGNLTCADIQTNGRALIGSDNSGLYLSNGPSYYGSAWSRVGAVDGLLSSQIWSIAWSNKNPAWGWVATGNGLFKTIDNGATWSRVLAGPSEFFETAKDIHCVATSPVDSMTVYVGWREATGDEHISRSEDKGSNWETVWNLSPVDSNCILAIELKDSGDNEDVLVVTGRAMENGRLHQLWVSENRGTLQRYTKFNIFGSDTVHTVLDATWTGSGDNILLSVAQAISATESAEQSKGKVYVSDGAVPAAWTQQVLTDTVATGAVWVSGSNYYVLNVQAPVTSGRGGLFTKSGSTWSQTTGGSWETGWTSAANAYGRTISNVAKSISDIGELWVTSSFAWRWNSNIYKACHTTQSGSAWTTTVLDNVNPAALAVDASLNVWAGFADIGLWKRSSSDGYWTDKNNAVTAWSGEANDHLGGNVNSILLDGSDVYVIESPEDQNSTYRLWQSTDGGSTWSCGSGTFSTDHPYMRSLIKESDYYYLTCDGDVWRVQEGGPTPIIDKTTWTKVLDVTQPLYTIAGSGSGTLLAGGPAGIYRSTSGALDSWSETKDLGFDSCVGEATGYKENWNGAHSFSFHAGSQTWACGSYWNNGSCGSPTYGVLKSSDDGQSWSTVTALRSVRTVYADSCGNRYFITTGSSMTNGVDNDDEWNRQRGLQVGRYGGSGTFYLTDQVYTGSVTGTVTGSTDNYRNPNANRMAAVTIGGTFYVYLAAQGYGVFMSTGVAGPPDDEVCGIERPGGGGMSLRPAVEERAFGVSYANGAFAPSHPGRIQVFDLLGRKVADLEAGPEAGVIPWSGKPGVYYARLRSGDREASARLVVLPR